MFSASSDSSTPIAECGSHQQHQQGAKSGSLHRSESSSDISVLSENPSQCSIEVLASQQHQFSPKQQPQLSPIAVAAENQQQEVAVEAETKTSALTPMPKKANPMLESSSSGSMTESVIATNISAAVAAPVEQVSDAVASEGEEEEEEAKAAEDGEYSSLGGGGADTDDASSYQTANSGSASLNSTSQMVTANTTLASVDANVSVETEQQETSALSDMSTPRVGVQNIRFWAQRLHCNLSYSVGSETGRQSCQGCHAVSGHGSRRPVRRPQRRLQVL